MKIYIAGPMRGKPDYNFPAFDAAARFLRQCGHTVCNPADRDREALGDTYQGDIEQRERAVAEGIDLRQALAGDLKWIAEEADAIWMLEGWETSLGARAEHALATALTLVGFRIFYDDNGGYYPEPPERQDDMADALAYAFAAGTAPLSDNAFDVTGGLS